MESLSGQIEHVIFHNAENGFTVLRVHTDRQSDPVTVVGTLPKAVSGEYIDATGTWVQNRDHGLQFKAEQLRTTPPSTIEGIEKYLASGVIKGIGKKHARKIVDLFGERTLAVIDENPAYLREIKGFGAKRVAQVRESWREQKIVRDIMVFLQSYGVGSRKRRGSTNCTATTPFERVRQDPYRLATDIWGIGFQSADQIAEKLGIDRASPLRARAGLKFVLKSLSDQGHCGFPEEGVVEQTTAMLQIDRDIVGTAVDHQCRGGDVIRENWAAPGKCRLLHPHPIPKAPGSTSMRSTMQSAESPAPSTSWVKAGTRCLQSRLKPRWHG